ncbi:serine/threonine protein kinase [candidate division KSB1 bacterium]|nr:serine/threonine protein kinase [candidate division KSB1 bacterium]
MSLTIGTVINDRYRIDAVLGSGAMGVVYKAWDPRIARYVAVKETALSEKEAKTLGQLNHPNIVVVHDSVEHHTDRYIVMEYVEGMTFEEKLKKEGTLSWQAALPLLKQVLLAASHIHKAKIFHRDLKPGNIMMTTEGAVKITDFGLGKIQEPDNIARSTNAGGTPYYMSPEQVGPKEKFGPVDHRSDIYAIGMTFYEALAGQTPLKSKTTQVEIFDAIRRDSFPSPRKFNANVPRGLAQIIMKAIAQKQRKRFQSAEEMLKAVEKFEEDMREPDKVKPPRFRLLIEIMLGLLSGALILTLVTIFKVPDLPLRMLKWVGLRSPTKIAIATEPPGAEIKIGGKAVGKSPVRSYYVDDDTLVVSLHKPNYFRIDSVMALQRGIDTPLSFTLRPAAMLAITVAPESAHVVIDGDTISIEQRKGLELAVGEHELAITLAGYAPINEKVLLRQGVNARIDTLQREVIAAVVPKGDRKPRHKTPLTPNGPKPASDTSVVKAHVEQGAIKLAINPPSAVYIGDSLAATAATACAFELPLGPATIKVIHSEKHKWLETIVLTAQGAVREIDFTKEYTLQIRAFEAFEALDKRPLSALIFVDGQSTGQLAPYNLPLNFGTHEIEVRMEGYLAQRRSLNVEKNDELEFRLDRVQ